MYSPQNTEQLIVDCTKVLLNLEKYTNDVSFDELFEIQDFVDNNPSINMHEFIPLANCTTTNPYLLRYGIYNAIMSIISINISKYFSGKLYNNIEIINDHSNSMRGHILKCDDLVVDVHIQNTDSTGICINHNWFALHNPDRVQMADIVNNLWIDISRTHLYELYKKYGIIIDTNYVNGDTKMYPISKDIWQLPGS